MGRCKKQRAYSFKPQFTSFAPLSKEFTGTITLNHDELEAVFLMDYQDLYQEDAAKLMNVSRPTLSRIIKNARNKIATAIIRGSNLDINDDKEDFKVAISLPSENCFASTTPKESLIAIIEIDEGKIQEISYIKNPIIELEERPSKILPQTLKQYGVNFFIASMMGEGLKNSLIAQGIFIHENPSISSFEDISRLFTNK